MSGARPVTIDRITSYLSGGGLFNPELADHCGVRDLLIDCRTDLAEALDALSNIDLSRYVNAASIDASDAPHVVVEKLQRAIRSKHAKGS